jgi:hypothetical protein
MDIRVAGLHHGENTGIMKSSITRTHSLRQGLSCRYWLCSGLVCWGLFASQTALAQLEVLQRCAAIAADNDRLACFDALAETLLSVPAATPEAGLSEVLPDAGRTDGVVSLPLAGDNREAGINTSGQAAATGNSSASFGLEQQVIAESGPGMILATVVAASRNRLGTWTVEFDNGQVWQQVGSENYSIREGETYRIERASRNSFLMKRDGYNRSIRVNRVR